MKFASGSINVVLGRNHSGKTNFCRLLAGLESAATAEITVDGSPLEGRDTALVYQAFVNYPHWTVAQNIASPIVARGKRDSHKVKELADLLQIGELLDRLPEELSGGQQQRLAIARAMAKSPRLLVMDEPFVNLDYKLRESLLGELRQLTRETGVCLVYATSDPRDAISLADQLLLVDRQEVIQAGEPLDLYQHPVSYQAADLMSDPGVNRYSGTEFVRPEHIHVADSGDGWGLATQGLIAGLETNGAESFVHARVSVPAGDIDWVARHPGMLDFRPGEPCWLCADRADLLTVPAEN